MVEVGKAVRSSLGPTTAASPRRLARRSENAAVRHVAKPTTDAKLATANESDRLLLDTAAGDRVAFRRLYEMSSARLYAAVRRSIWIKSEADEVLQEVYLKIWNGAGAYDPGQAQSITWMLRVARNHSIDHLRRCAMRRAHEFAFDSDHDTHDIDAGSAHQLPVDDAPRPDEWLEMQQDQRRFDQLMSGLGAMQRQVLVLAFREGCTQADIAERLDAPIGSVKSWMRRALQRLKVSIDAQAACDA